MLSSFVYRFPLFLGGVLLLWLGCAAPEASNDAADADPSWVGRYEGTLPCADCSGIHTTLELAADARYTLTQVYQGQSPDPVVQRGRFRWVEPKTTLVLVGTSPLQFAVEEDRLVQLDANGHRVASAFAALYTLSKI